MKKNILDEVDVPRLAPVESDGRPCLQPTFRACFHPDGRVTVDDTAGCQDGSTKAVSRHVADEALRDRDRPGIGGWSSTQDAPQNSLLEGIDFDIAARTGSRWCVVVEHFKEVRGEHRSFELIVGRPLRWQWLAYAIALVACFCQHGFFHDQRVWVMRAEGARAWAFRYRNWFGSARVQVSD
jgi:hypothetical protein